MSDRIEPLILSLAQERGLLDYGTVMGQMEKLKKKHKELILAIEENDQPIIEDTIGYMVVILTILAYLRGTTLRNCYRKAYNEIKNRKDKSLMELS